MLVCSRVWCTTVLPRSHARLLDVFTCLACLHALVVGVFTCLRVTCLVCLLVLCSYVLTCFTCLLCSNILRAYVLACFFDILCPIFFTFEKLTSKNPYIEKFLFIQRSIWNPPEHLSRSFLRKRIKG